MTKRQVGLVGLGCAAVLLVVYGLTMAPGLSWAHHGADGGDLLTALARGGIPHPPGFPTYLLLGGLFVHFPGGDLAWRLNLLSAVLSAAACGLSAAACARRAGRFEPALATGLCLGLAPLFWSQALIAEVYALAAFFAALLLLLALRRGPAWALGLAWGVGLGAHPTLLLLAPLLVWGVWAERGGLWRLVQLALLAALGWAVLYGPVLLLRGSAPSPWADVSTPAGWWELVSGRLYHGYILALPWADVPRRLLAWAGLVARQFTPLGALLAGWGWLALWRERRWLAGASALTVALFSLYAIGYNTVDSLVYLVPALPLTALWLGRGLERAGVWLGQRARWGRALVLCLPLLQALLFWGRLDLSGDRAAEEWADQLLAEAPPEAVLVSAEDRHTFALWYVHGVLGERPDLVVLDRDLWQHAPYRQLVAQTLGVAEGIASWPEAARRTGRPVVYLDDP